MLNIVRSENHFLERKNFQVANVLMIYRVGMSKRETSSYIFY